jgi:membrane protease YdiL (CAAX protease family)
MSYRYLVPFFVITFTLTWGLALLFVFFQEPITAIFGELSMTNPLFILAVYSPGFAAIGLIVRAKGVRGVRQYLRRLLLWRAPVVCHAFIWLGIPAIMIAGAALGGNLRSQPFPYSPWYSMFPALAVTLFIGPIEELGWRGFALPLLQQRFSPFTSAMVLGVIWGVWHIPAFLLGGTPQSAWSFTPYFVAVLAISIVMTAIFNASSGSLLIAALVHFQLNNPIFPDAQPYDSILFTIVAVIVVFVMRKKMFDPAEGITDIFLPSETGAAIVP